MVIHEEQALDWLTNIGILFIAKGVCEWTEWILFMDIIMMFREGTS